MAMGGDVGRGEYRFGPFLFDSDIDLGGMGLGAGDGGGIRVRIEPGVVPEAVAAGEPVTAWVRAGGGGCLLTVPEVGRFAVMGGTRVVVELVEGAAAGDVRSYLTAWCFGALCHQNGMLPLHASAVERDGRVTALLGESGAGKSTLAAFLERAGDRVVCDDVCLLAEDGDGMGIVPVAAWLKLWRGAMEALGEEMEEGARTYGDEDKYRRGLVRVAGAGLRVGAGGVCGAGGWGGGDAAADYGGDDGPVDVDDLFRVCGGTDGERTAGV